jgi:hypothetical protein
MPGYVKPPVNGRVNGTMEMIPSLSTQTPLTIKGAVSQSANLLNIQNSSGTTIASVNPSGIASHPNTPAFQVYSQTSTQSGNLTYTSTYVNNGSYMNLGTGLFTAPIAGHYFFHYYGFVETGISGNTTITFQKNGSAIPSRAYNDFNDASYGPVITLGAVIYLAVNDNVRVNISGAGMHGNDNSYFKGFLIG